MSEKVIATLALDRVSRDDLVRAINAAYVDYYVPIYLTPQSFEYLIQREDIRPEASVAALDGSQIVGMGLLAIRQGRGWIGGMGVLPDRRGQGIGRQMMRFLIDAARGRGLHRLQLEVITHNQRAHHLYRSLGFVEKRRLSVLFTGDAPPAPVNPPDGISVGEDNPAALLDALPRFAAADLPWQHDLDSMRAVIDRVDGLAARDRDGDLAGVCLWSGEEHQAGVLSLGARAPHVGAALIGALRRRLPEARLSYLNVPEDDPMLTVLLDAGFEESLAQYEMILDLSRETPA